VSRLLITWAGNVLALYVAAWALPGVDYGHDGWTLLLAGIVFTLVNRLVKPVVTILSIPFIVVTLGLFLLVVNALMLYLTDWIVPGFELRSFGAAVVAAIIVSLVNWVLHLAFGRPGR
jgi:putative membrane protein